MVEAFDDPKVEGVACFVSRARTGGISGSLGLAEDTLTHGGCTLHEIRKQSTGDALFVSEVIVEGRLGDAGGRDDLVHGEEQNPLDRRLRYEDPVEWIAVEIG